MKKWIKNLVIIVAIFAISFIVIYNIVDINENVSLPKGATLVHMASKNMAVGSLAFIVTSVIIEIVTILRYINNTNSPEKFKSNVIKFLALTLVLLICCAFAYYFYKFNSINLYHF